ncbi:MAG: transposase [Bacteriovoracales bacterium]|nr:transposase [Bacteriovoracales bacterium]
MKTVELSNELWERIRPHLPPSRPRLKGGRPRLNSKRVFEGILFIKANGLPWKASDKRVFGSKTALNDYYRTWAKRGVFHALRESGILSHPELAGIDLGWEKMGEVFGRGQGDA